MYEYKKYLRIFESLLDILYENDQLNYPQILQNFKRMYIEVLNNDKKIAQISNFVNYINWNF